MSRTGQNNKIRYPIVSLYPIDMMNNFIFSKIATKFFLHYKAMFLDVKIWFSRIGMVSLQNCSVASSHNDSAVPEMAVFPKLNREASATIRAKSSSIVCVNEIIFTFYALSKNACNSSSRRKGSLPISILGLFDSFWKIVETHDRAYNIY